MLNPSNLRVRAASTARLSWFFPTSKGRYARSSESFWKVVLKMTGLRLCCTGDPNSEWTLISPVISIAYSKPIMS